MKILAVNIGNSRVAFGTFQDGQLTQAERHMLGADSAKLIEAVQVWGEMAVGQGSPAIIASVNPRIDDIVCRTLAQDVGIEVRTIGKDIPLPIELDVLDPAKVGVDRALNAAAAYERIKEAVAVVDAGTAITVDCVSAQGVFLGGTILPGLRLSAKILHQQTALLPEVEVVRPNWVYGKNTQQAIIAGIYYGALGAVRELVERYAEQLKVWPVTIVTGGDGELLRIGCDFIQAYVPDLTLMGIELAYRQSLVGDG